MHKAVADVGATMTADDVELERGSMRAAVDRWRKARPRPDAICAYNDELAVGLLSVLAERGVRVPGDIAVIGVDDIPLASSVSPTLTTVGYSLEAVGVSIAQTLATLVDSDELEGEFQIPDIHVIVRESA